MPRVVPDLFPSTDHVQVVRFQGFEKPRYLTRVILKVGIHCEDNFAARAGETSCECGGFSKIPTEANATDTPIVLGELLDLCPGSVGGSIIDEQDL